MIIGLPLLIAVIAIAPSYFKSSPIEITKTESTVEKKVFDKKLPPTDVGKEESTTVYEFVCDSDVDYDVVDENKVSRNKSQVRIKVTRARANLKLPITVWLSQTIPNRRADFEDGHVKICQRIFVDAHEAANAACHRVIGRTFFGEGNDLEVAKKNAVEIAKQEIREQYVQSVGTKAKDVLLIYDFYAPTWRQSADILVDRALQEYEIGKPRKLSRVKRTTDTTASTAPSTPKQATDSPAAQQK